MKNILLSLMLVLLSGYFNDKPKCDDDEWVYFEYGLNEQSLRPHFKFCLI
ncbi:hypothetical protein C414_000420014 [Campylobacter jejuni subsp. jejuni 414]|nr:hypothetical protein C414_000420014 [Campylobacter jejuni subsp. jejuni 414]HDZ5075353.1 hypothetical protein [Campylobacter jejuni]